MFKNILLLLTLCFSSCYNILDIDDINIDSELLEPNNANNLIVGFAANDTILYDSFLTSNDGWLIDQSNGVQEYTYNSVKQTMELEGFITRFNGIDSKRLHKNLSIKDSHFTVIELGIADGGSNQAIHDYKIHFSNALSFAVEDSIRVQSGPQLLKYYVSPKTKEDLAISISTPAATPGIGHEGFMNSNIDFVRVIENDMHLLSDDFETDWIQSGIGEDWVVINDVLRASDIFLSSGVSSKIYYNDNIPLSLSTTYGLIMDIDNETGNTLEVLGIRGDLSVEILATLDNTVGVETVIADFEAAESFDAIGIRGHIGSEFTTQNYISVESMRVFEFN